MFFVYINIMRKYQDRLNTPLKLKPLDQFRCCTTTCASDISSDTGLERRQCAGSLKMRLATNRKRNNVDRNDQPSSTIAAVKKI